MGRIKLFLALLALLSLASACSDSSKESNAKTQNGLEVVERMDLSHLISKYITVRLTADLSQLTEKQQQMIPLLIEAGEIMDELFWYEAYGKRDSLMDMIQNDTLKRFVQINYGPWDRLNGNQPYIKGVGPKPAGANFYPEDMTKDDFEAANLEDKQSLYTFLRYDENGNLKTIPYHLQFETQVKEAARLLREAAALAEYEGLKTYLELRAAALLNDDYQPSDLAWLDMEDNAIDVVIGPIETYEDQLFGYKAAHECYVLLKDMEWSERLKKYATFLPSLQEGLPVPPQYKAETPGRDAQLNAYDVVFYAGDCNAGSKTIAINLPNDEEVQLQKGTRRLQLKNAMRAKFDKILVPIANQLIAEDQRQYITFDAFFGNTMFHEVAHGLGIKNTINGRGTVREALKEHASALEEGKADILGLYMIKQLHERGEIEGDLKEYYTTFMAGIFRSVRFGASSAHGKANMIRFNFFQEQDAFQFDEATGTYRVDFEKLEAAAQALSERILTLQGDGDYQGVAQLVEEKGKIGPKLQTSLDALSDAGIPVDIVFEQGVDVLGI
jgi:hypothetical protein